jgi:hypothetical protein
VPGRRVFRRIYRDLLPFRLLLSKARAGTAVDLVAHFRNASLPTATQVDDCNNGGLLRLCWPARSRFSATMQAGVGTDEKAIGVASNRE